MVRLEQCLGLWMRRPERSARRRAPEADGYNILNAHIVVNIFFRGRERGDAERAASSRVPIESPAEFEGVPVAMY